MMLHSCASPGKLLQLSQLRNLNSSNTGFDTNVSIKKLRNYGVRFILFVFLCLFLFLWR